MGFYIHTFPTPQEKSNNPRSGNLKSTTDQGMAPPTSYDCDPWCKLDLEFFSNPCFQRLELVVLQNLSCLPITQAVSFFLFFTKHSVPAEVRSVYSLKNDSFPRGAGMTELQVHGCLRIKGEKVEDMSKGCSGLIVCIIFRALLAQGGEVPYV